MANRDPLQGCNLSHVGGRKEKEDQGDSPQFGQEQYDELLAQLKQVEEERDAVKEMALESAAEAE